MKTKCHFVTLALVVLLSTAALGQGGIYNFYNTWPYGPPVTNNTVEPNVLFVNQITLPAGDSQVIAGANFYVTEVGTNATLCGCVYQDLNSAPIWQSAQPITTAGPGILSAPWVMMEGGTKKKPKPFYWAWVATGSELSIAGFNTDAFSYMQQIYNEDTVRWGTSANYVEGSGACPSSLGPLAPAPATLNLAAFYLHQ